MSLWGHNVCNVHKSEFLWVSREQVSGEVNSQRGFDSQIRQRGEGKELDLQEEDKYKTESLPQLLPDTYSRRSTAYNVCS